MLKTPHDADKFPQKIHIPELPEEDKEEFKELNPQQPNDGKSKFVKPIPEENEGVGYEPAGDADYAKVIAGKVTINCTCKKQALKLPKCEKSCESHK